MELLDPTSEVSPARRMRKSPPDKIAGLTVGLLDISKPRGNIFLDRIEQRLGEKGVAVKRYRKPTFTRPAPNDLAQKIASEVDLVIEGLAD